MKKLFTHFLVLDIETSTHETIDKNGIKRPSAVWLSYGYCKLYTKENGIVKACYFRTWEELDEFLIEIVYRFIGFEIICYVHNLSYEADFMFKNLSLPSKMLCNNSHDVICCKMTKYQSIEFRCSYFLTSQSLAKLGEMVGLPKLDSEYRTILPADYITEEEKVYCSRDCDIVALAITKLYIPEYGTISNIPYTKTGRVRKKFSEFYKINKEKELKWDLMPDENCYDLLCNSFRGAITISNPKYTGVLLHNIESYDERSEYPSVMLVEKFPRYLKRIKGNPTTEYWIAKVKFKKIDSKYNWLWLSRYKMQEYEPFNSIFFNGKLHYSDEIVTTITNIDLDIINQTYVYESIEFIETAECYDVEYLPDSYYDTLETFSKLKYELKKELKKLNENDEKWQETSIDYMKAKNDFNSIYGMTVQKLMSPEYELDKNFIWYEKDTPYKKEDKQIKRNFLFGIYITAYARRNLIQAIIKNCPDTFVYADTDSIKYIQNKPFIETNKLLPFELESIPSFSGLGLFEHDEKYDDFITFGAKKYAYTIDGVAHATVAGLPKKIKTNEGYIDSINSLNEFYLGKTFDNCKLAKLYLYNGKSFMINDEDEIIELLNHNKETQQFLEDNNIQTNGGVALFRTSYTLNISSEDKEYLKDFYRREL